MHFKYPPAEVSYNFRLSFLISVDKVVPCVWMCLCSVSSKLSTYTECCHALAETPRCCSLFLDLLGKYSRKQVNLAQVYVQCRHTLRHPVKQTHACKYIGCMFRFLLSSGTWAMVYEGVCVFLFILFWYRQFMFFSLFPSGTKCNEIMCSQSHKE